MKTNRDLLREMRALARKKCKSCGEDDFAICKQKFEYRLFQMFKQAVNPHDVFWREASLYREQLDDYGYSGDMLSEIFDYWGEYFDEYDANIVSAQTYNKAIAEWKSLLDEIAKSHTEMFADNAYNAIDTILDDLADDLPNSRAGLELRPLRSRLSAVLKKRIIWFGIAALALILLICGFCPTHGFLRKYRNHEKENTSELYDRLIEMDK